MSEEVSSSKRLQNLMRICIIIMLVLLILCPFELEIRINWYFYPQVQVSSISLFSWFGEYRLFGYEPAYRMLPFYQLVQFGSFPTSAQIFFLGAFIGFHLGLTERKTAFRFGIFSLIPSTVLLVVRLLAMFIPGSTEVIVSIPLLAVSYLGLIILRLTKPQPSKDEWLSDDDNSQ